MEAQRVRPQEVQVKVQAQERELPPPPAPFPTELISPSQPNGQVQGVQAQISSVQRSIIDVLTDLLSGSPQLDNPSHLSQRDQRLATALTELLEVTYDLDSSDLPTGHSDSEGNLEDSFHALKQSLDELQNAPRASDGTEEEESSLHPAIYAVREELHWARLDSLSNAIVSLVQERKDAAGQLVNGTTTNGTTNEGRLSEDPTMMPPRYSFDEEVRAGGSEKATLPGYTDHLDVAESLVADPGKRREIPESLRPSVPAPREKMMLELDGLTDAIGRLHSAIPRLNDQRVEMKASSSKTTITSPEIKARAERDKLRELEIIWEQIERTHGKGRMRDGPQRVDGAGWDERCAKQRDTYLSSLFDNTEANRLHDQDSSMGKVDAELARARDLRDRDLFLRELVEQSADTRLSDQDADQPATSACGSEDRRHRFFTRLLDSSQSGHLEGQDYPMTLDERLDQRRREFIESVVLRTTNGRLRNQDSAPPTPRTRTETAVVNPGDPEELVTMQDFFKEKRERSNPTPIETEKRVNGFDRIKGIIRKGSAGLGIKVNNEADLANLSYIAEHQENLNAVQVMLHGVGISAQTDLILETEADESDQALLSSKTSPTMQSRLTLPTPAVPRQSISLLLQNLHLEARVASLPSASSASALSLNTVITQALSASELRQLQPRSLCCAACDREIADLPSNTSYKDLPSEHWAEMLEIWMCHSDPGFTAGISAKAKDGFWPEKGVVLVGGSYVLLEDAHAKGHALVTQDQSVAGWKSVHCFCGEVLGKQRDRDERPGAGTVRFSKWSIALLQEDEGYDAEAIDPIRYPISVFIVSDLLELAQAHASYRFIVSDEESGRPRLLLWLFNPSTRISYRQSTIHAQPSPLRTPKTATRRSFASSKSRRSSHASLSSIGRTQIVPEAKSIRASKIMYKVLETDEVYENVPGFGPTGQIERLQYPLDVVDRLTISLKDSTALYPVGRRTMGEFEIGFLQRV